MIGLVLVTHGRLAVEFRIAMEHVVGPQDAIETSGKVRRPALRSSRSRFQPMGKAKT